MIGNAIFIALHLLALLSWPVLLFLTVPLHLIYAAVRKPAAAPPGFDHHPVGAANARKAKVIVGAIALAMLAGLWWLLARAPGSA